MREIVKVYEKDGIYLVDLEHIFNEKDDSIEIIEHSRELIKSDSDKIIDLENRIVELESKIRSLKKV